MNSELTQEAFEEEKKKRQKRRSIALAGILIGVVIVFYMATIFRMGGNVLNKSGVKKYYQGPGTVIKNESNK